MYRIIRQATATLETMNKTLKNYPQDEKPHTLPPTIRGQPPHFATPQLACKGSRARVGVGGGHGVVDVDEDAGVVRLVSTRERDQVGRLCAATPSHTDLRAREEELRAVGRLGELEGDLLVAHEVVACGDARRNGDGDVLLVWYRCIPCQYCTR